MFDARRENRLAEVEQKLQLELAGELAVARSKPFFLEFTEAGVTKGTSLEWLANRPALSAPTSSRVATATTIYR